MNIVLLGPPGSGKSTQAKLLSKTLGLPHFTTGGSLRGISHNPSHPLYKEISKQLNKGLLVRNDIVNELLSEAVTKSISYGGIIIDGTPRRKSQVKALDEVLKKHNQKLDLVIFVDTSLPESKKRLLDRSKVEHRRDDTPEDIEVRIKIYKKDTLPILKEYAARNILKRVNGDLAVETIHIKIVKSVNTLKSKSTI